MSLDFGKGSRSIAFDPTSAFPLDARCYFESYDEAVLAAEKAEEAGSTDTVYYYGLTLTVYDKDNNKVKTYVILSDNTLEELGSGEDFLSLKADYENFKNLINSAPKISHTMEEDSTRIHDFLVGEEVYLLLNIESKKVGQCTVNIDYKDGMDKGGIYIPSHRLVVTPGNNIKISLGKATGFSLRTYRISVLDSTNIPAEDPAYLYYKVKTGSISLTHSFELGSNTYSEEFDEELGKNVVTVSIPYKIDAGIVVGNRVFNTQITYTNQATGKQYTTNLPDATVLADLGLFTIKFNAFEEDGSKLYGNYNIKLICKLNDEDLYASNEITITIPVLETNSSSVVLLSTLTSTLTTDDSISVSFIPTTSSRGAQGTNALTAVIKIDCSEVAYTAESIKYTKQLDKGNLNLVTISTYVTHGITCSLYLGKQKMPTFNDLAEYISSELPSEGTITNIKCTLSIEVQPTQIGSFEGHKPGFYNKDFTLLYYAGDQAIGLDSPQNIEFNLNTLSNITEEDWKSTYSDPIIKFYDISALSGIETTLNEYSDTVSYFKFAAGTSGLAEFSLDTIKALYSLEGAGFALETYINCLTLGEQDEVGLYLKTVDGDAIKVVPGKASINFKGISLSATIPQDKLTHIVFVYDPGVTESNVNPYPTLRIYVDGILTAIARYTDNTAALGQIDLLSFGAEYDKAALTFINKCNVDLALFRIYNKALKMGEVLSNFKACISSNQRSEVKLREDAGVVEVHFIKNQGVGNILDKSNTANYTFAEMNQIEIKNGTLITPGSKNAYVNCTMYCGYANDATNLAIKKWIKYDDVDVWLQGTSSLKYPVKNYLIKLWKDRDETKNATGERINPGTKNKIIPPFQDESTGWYTKDYVYTLKCDYMEHSHRNNTPTACLYEDTILEKVIDWTTLEYPASKPSTLRSKLYSPAKRIENASNEKIYRDAINGFPCKVYYHDNLDINNDLNNQWVDSGETAEFGTAGTYEPNATEILAGTFMFNVDKEGAQLGFEVSVANAIKSNSIFESLPRTSAESDLASKSLIPGYNCTYDETTNEYKYFVYAHSNGKVAPITYTGTGNDREYTFNIKYADGADGPLYVSSEVLPCVSYEGATNNNSSAAAFYPLDKIDLTEAYKAYVNSLYENYKNIVPRYNDDINLDGSDVKAYAVFCFDTLEKKEGGYELGIPGNDIKISGSTNIAIIELDNESISPIEVTVDDNGFLVKDGSRYTSGNKIKIQIQLNTNEAGGNYITSLIELANKYSAEKYTDFYDFIAENGANDYLFSAVSHKELGGEIVYVDYYIDAIKTKELYIAVQDEDTVYDYIANTLEPRFTYTEDYEKLDYFNKLTYDPIKTAIEWVYGASLAYIDDKNYVSTLNGRNVTFTPNTFKNEFETYFSFEYCLTYYLQMMLFTQVDNAGKNAMFDTWGDGRLYPRPYDMDTLMGLDNSGHDAIPVSAELHWDLSPYECVSDPTAPASVGNAAQSTSEAHSRFKRYNTYESRLWKTFGKVFLTEILKCYKYLRTAQISESETRSAYSIDYICDFINSKTAEAFSEALYNSDVESKYLGYKVAGKYSENYLYVTQGNRKNRYKEFLTQRMAFLDSVFKYTDSVTNGSTLLRCNALTNVSKFGIEVTTPTYIQFVVDSGEQALVTAYVDPEDTFELDNGQVYKGVLFNIPTTGADKNIIIYGMGSIKNIHFLKDLRPTHIELTSARCLTSVDLSGADSLKELTFGNNIYLKNANLRSTQNLKTNIDLSNCTNLETVDIASSKITGLVLPAGAPISTINISNSTLLSIHLEGLKKLKITNNSSTGDLKYSGCTTLTTIEFIDCPLLESFNFAQFPKLSSLRVDRCEQIETIVLNGMTNLNTLDLESCDNLTKVSLDSCAGNVFKKLNFSLIPKLSDLSVCATQIPGGGTGVIYLALHSVKDTVFTRLRLYDTCISGLSTSGDILEDSASEADRHTYDFNGIKFSTDAILLFYTSINSTNVNNTVVKYIKNLTYAGNVVALFKAVTNLEKVENLSITPSSTKLDLMFLGCVNLTDVLFKDGNHTNWDIEPSSTLTLWNNILSISSIFYNCKKIALNTVRNFLYRVPNVTNIDSLMCLAYSKDADGPTELPSNFFEHNKQLQKLSYAFYATKFTKVHEGIFNYLTDQGSVTDVSCMFTYCSDLLEVPQGIFSKLSGLTTARSAFLSCTKLGETRKPDSILVSSFKGVFNTGAKNLADVSNMFANCPYIGPDKLETNWEEGDHVGHFFEDLDGLVLANSVFANCGTEGYGIKKLPSCMFGSSKTNLVNIDGIFMNAGLDCDLPADVLGEENCLPNLVTARGAFCDNPKLIGGVSGSFFSACPNIISIGATSLGKFNFTINGVNYKGPSIYLGAPGIFANTGITSMHIDTLLNLSKLEDCSYMFYTGKSGIIGSQSTFNLTFVPPTDDSGYREFLIDIGQGEQNLIDVIPTDLFTGSSKIKDVSGMFAFTKGLKAIRQFDINNSLLDDYTESEGLFTPFCTKLTNAAGMFAGSKDFEYVNLYKLFEGCNNLQNIAAMFADTKLNFDFSTTLIIGEDV